LLGNESAGQSFLGGLLLEEKLMSEQCDLSQCDLLGRILLERGLLDEADIEKALRFQHELGGRIGGILVRLGALSEETLLPVLAWQLELPLLDAIENIELDAILSAIQASQLAQSWFVTKQVVVWIGLDGGVCCASRNPLESTTQEVISLVFPMRSVSWYLARSQDVESLLGLLQKTISRDELDEVAHLREMAEEAPAIELVNSVLSQAMDEGASDIHLEPEAQAFQVRYRIDGVLKLSMSLPRERFDAVASRIKLISGMDIAERRLPQDGRISTRAGGTEIDIRVSALPASEGESIVMRLLPKDRASLHLDALGMERDHYDAMSRLLAEPHGIVLITGPTGSGKSTTLYAGLESINNRDRKIITVEDPVEFKIKGITQVQAQSDIGYSFATALRSILRQDPDIIMIGEIRDAETARIAIQSAMTGHLVLSTLHTNTALSAFNRLLDMGIEPFLVASSVRAVQAQRLIRRLCTCAEKHQPIPSVLEVLSALKRRYPNILGDAESQWRLPKGCPRCRGTGYRGRLGIYEFYEVNEVIQDAVMRRASTAELVEIASNSHVRTMREDGVMKASRGLTSLEEVFRVTGLGEAL